MVGPLFGELMGPTILPVPADGKNDCARTVEANIVDKTTHAISILDIVISSFFRSQQRAAIRAPGSLGATHCARELFLRHTLCSDVPTRSWSRFRH
jgi:hypothetical protein